MSGAEGRGVLAVLLRRTPFRLALAGCTLAGVEAAARHAELPRSYRLRVRDGVLLLRHYGSGLPSSTWSVKGSLEQDGDTVRLAGRQRYLYDRCVSGMFTAFTLLLLGVGVWLGVAHGPGYADARGAFIAGLVMAGPTLFLLWLGPGLARRRDARATEVLRAVLVGC